MSRARLWSFLLAGSVVAGSEVLLVVATEQRWFLSLGELARYALFAFCLLPVLCVALGAPGAWLLAAVGRGPSAGGDEHLRRLRRWAFLVAGPTSAVLIWALTAGRRARELPGRTVLVLGGALLLAALAAMVVALLVREHARSRRAAVGFGLWGLCALLVAIDMYVLRRLYPAFHVALFALALAAALTGSAFVVKAGPRARRLAPVAALALLLGAGAGGYSLVRAPNGRFAVLQAAPLTGRVLAGLSLPTRPEVATTPSAAGARSRPAMSAAHAGIDLRGRDVLLVTIDALRADNLRAYGGHGLTPNLDALALDSMVFTRAYTPTPHTSYALSSLLTGKFMRPLLELSSQPGEHPTLPELLRHHGYRTAAFFPPAIFFVDQERFAWLREKQLGFEYVKAMYAPAADRVVQLQRYLAGVERGLPVFVWVHLFEPHEPYDPPADFARGDSPRERYDGEVRAADAAIAGLVAAFRASRPGATVIVTADHGEEFGEHGGYFHGSTLFDEQIRIPLLWSSPGAVRPGRSNAAVELLDIATTLLAALGIPREARMRGDDLGPALAGVARLEELRAFASLERARMLTDGKHKLLCDEAGCTLFDLLEDPSERRDLSAERPAVVRSLLGELSALAATFPRVEALAMESGGAWPEALVRARLGDRAAAPELVPLLGSSRAEVRAAASRWLGELGAQSARPALANLRERDPDPEVRGEAAVAALRLEEPEAQSQAAALLTGTEALQLDPQLQRRAALALATRKDAAGSQVLLAAARDQALDESERVQAIRALAEVGSSAESRGLLELLIEVRLRSEVARTLGRIGDRSVTPALVTALASERYPEARRALAEALLALGAKKPALAAVRRFLGTESSMPDGVRILRDAGALSAHGADLAHDQSRRRGSWQCGDQGCRPLAAAAIRISKPPVSAGGLRATLRVSVDPGASRTVTLLGQTRSVRSGESELAWSVAGRLAIDLPVQADAGVWLQAIALLPVQKDVPPPPPEPWPSAQGSVPRL